jgi:hypothetical protein
MSPSFKASAAILTEQQEQPNTSTETSTKAAVPPHDSQAAFHPSFDNQNEESARENAEAKSAFYQRGCKSREGGGVPASGHEETSAAEMVLHSGASVTLHHLAPVISRFHVCCANYSGAALQHTLHTLTLENFACIMEIWGCEPGDV